MKQHHHRTAAGAGSDVNLLKDALHSRPKNMKSNNTLEDVARLAKVSSATVSRVINKTTRVSPEVQSRIRAAAEKLGFDLRKRNRTRLIAFVLSNRSLLYPFHSQVLLAAQAYCAAQDYDVVFVPLQYTEGQDAEKLHLPSILQRADVIDGFIVSGVNHQNLFDALSRTELPFAILGDTVQGAWKEDQQDVVRIEDGEGAYEVTRYLLGLGHTGIAFLGNIRLAWFARRHQGYLRAMKEAGLQAAVCSVDSENEHEIGFIGMKQLWSEKGRATSAIFCASDAIAFGVYTALRELDVAVPEAISVCGFNDTPDAKLLFPPLTSVNVFPDLIGRSLAEQLLARIQDPARPRQSRILHTQLVKRESCLPALSFQAVQR
jgi:DNA-binding LacI/PurR family transcriptional regulator